MNGFDYLNSELIEKIRNIPFLKSFDEDDLRKILELSEIRQYRKDDRIIAEGSYGTSIYILISGMAKIMKNGEDVCVFEEMGEVFGEMSAIDRSPRSASIYAKEDTVCLALDISFNKIPFPDRERFRSIVYQEFAEILTTRLRMTTEELIRAKRRSV